MAAAKKTAAKKAGSAPASEKSEPKRTDADNSHFEKAYLVKLHPGDDLTDELKDQQVNDVRNSAIQVGLRPTGDVTGPEQEDQEHGNVLLTYSVPVEPASKQGDRQVRVNEDDSE